MWGKKINMADAETLEVELKQEESTASVKSDTEETSEETPNGVKTWVKIMYCSFSSVQPLASWAKMESCDASGC